ncbi:MAG: hypothetical protein ACREEM_14020 [Blastocatellia bacterium]
MAARSSSARSSSGCARCRSSSVVGERRIGKSSLLYHLMQTGARRIADGRYRFFYLDMQDARFHTAAGFMRAILKALGGAPGTIPNGLDAAIKDEQARAVVLQAIEEEPLR